MPHVDLETLLCGGGSDARVACETQIDPDLPPEAIVVRIGGDGGLDWAYVAAAVYERDDSTKGSSNPKAQAQHRQQHANLNSNSSSNSKRFSGGGLIQPKPPIIALPAKIRHHSCYLGRSVRRPGNAPVFPKKLSSVPGGGRRKSAVPDEEPGSPKVSCFGKVLSQRERDRCRQLCPTFSEEEENTESAAPAACWASFSAFCCGSRVEKRPVGSAGDQEAKPRDAPGKAARERRMAGKPTMDPPELGSMRRFSSGRRPASWGVGRDVDLYEAEAEAEADGGHVTRLQPLNRDGPAWGPRRSVGSLVDAWRERDGETDGSASV